MTSPANDRHCGRRRRSRSKIVENATWTNILNISPRISKWLVRFVPPSSEYDLVAQGREADIKSWFQTRSFTID